jgi:hypothetical protein
MADGKTGDGEITEHDLGALIAHEISSAVTYDQSELSTKRARAIEYYRGEMTDTPSRPNGSTVTSRDLADTMSWMLPGIMRVFMASDRMAEFEPVAPDIPDPQAYKRAEENAEQASDYISYVFNKDNDGYRIVYNTTHDSLLTGNGIVKHWWDDTPECEYSNHSRLTLEQVAMLKDEEGVEIQAQEKNKEPDMVMDPETGQPMPVETYNIKIKRETSRGKLRVLAIAAEDFLLNDGAALLDDFRFCAHHDPNMTRSRLIEMGFDKVKVDAIPAEASALRRTEVATARYGDKLDAGNSLIKSMEVIDYYECYLKIDVDNDGVAETVKIHYAGSAGAGEVLDWEVWEDELPFSDVPCYPQPHRFDAQSVADRTVDIQQIKTVLQRQALDNLYVSNLPMQEVEAGSVLNPDILISPKFGGIIWKKTGSNPLIPHVIPFVADKVLAATEYFDRIIEKRTGVSRTMMALDPEALQNQTATANQNARDASYSQNELVARNMAELGWRRVFRALLRLVVKHQDRPRMIRLRGKFVEMDPRQWNANMDVTVNTGLGTGSRDRDMAMLQMVAANQVGILKELAVAGFKQEAIDIIPKLRLTFVKQAESAGIRNPDMFYPDFDEQKLEGMRQQAEAASRQPPLEIQIEQARLQAQGQLKQVELQAQQQTEMVKAEGNKVKEAAQLEADLVAKQADRETELQLKAADMEIKREEIASRERIEMMKMQMAQQPDPMKERELSLKERSAGLDGELKVAQHNSAMIETQGKPGSKVKQHPVMDAATKASEKTAQLEQMIAELAAHASAPVEIVRDKNGVAGARKGGRFYPVKRDASGRVTGVGSPTVQ